VFGPASRVSSLRYTAHRWLSVSWAPAPSYKRRERAYSSEVDRVSEQGHAEMQGCRFRHSDIRPCRHPFQRNVVTKSAFCHQKSSLLGHFISSKRIIVRTNIVKSRPSHGQEDGREFLPDRLIASRFMSSKSSNRGTPQNEPLHFKEVWEHVSRKRRPFIAERNTFTRGGAYWL